MDIEEIKDMKERLVADQSADSDALLWIIEQLEQAYDLQVARLEPGDVIVINIPRRISDADHESIVRQVTRVFPGGHKVLVIDDGSKLSAVRPEADVATQEEWDSRSPCLCQHDAACPRIREEDAAKKA